MEPTLEDRVDQTRRMRDIVARLTLLSYTSAARIDTETARQKPTGGDKPPGDPNPLHLEFWWRFISEPDFERRELVICEAEDARIAVQKGPSEKPEGETKEEWEERLIREGKGWPARDVAVRFHTSTTVVLKLRERFECNGHDGLPREDVAIPVLVEKGYSARQIALIVGCSPQKAQYHVSKARLKEAA